MPIELTETAAQEIKNVIDQQKLDAQSTHLRVGVKAGGCSSCSYVLDLTDQKHDDDQVFDAHGISIVCDSQSYTTLQGTTIDFRDEPMGRGFVFDNPNAKQSGCGCGSSESSDQAASGQKSCGCGSGGGCC